MTVAPAVEDELDEDGGGTITALPLPSEGGGRAERGTIGGKGGGGGGGGGGCC